jgi:hypothetical protein
MTLILFIDYLYIFCVKTCSFIDYLNVIDVYRCLSITNIFFASKCAHLTITYMLSMFIDYLYNFLHQNVLIYRLPSCYRCLSITYIFFASKRAHLRTNLHLYFRVIFKHFKLHITLGSKICFYCLRRRKILANWNVNFVNIKREAFRYDLQVQFLQAKSFSLAHFCTTNAHMNM